MGKRNSAKNWLTLNAHGKDCLHSYLAAISANDLRTSQLDYLYNKELVDYATRYSDAKEREELAGHCLTDLGLNTAKHYFPNYL